MYSNSWAACSRQRIPSLSRSSPRRAAALLPGVATILSAVGAVVLLLGVLIPVWELLLLALLLGVGCWIPVLFDEEADW